MRARPANRQRPSRLRQPSRALALRILPGLIFLCISLIYFGRPVILHLTTRYIGAGPDPTNMFMWSLAWWPFALTHGVNPFLSGYIWSPLGFNITWLTSIPFLSLLMWPVTWLFGLVASYNVLMILTPALSAFTAFLLVRRLSGRWWIGLWGGYMFGFSSYEFSQMLGHSNLAFTALVPLLIYIIICLYERRNALSRWTPAVLIGLILAAQYAISSEILATLSLFGLCFLGIAWLVVRKERTALAWVLRSLLWGYAVAFLLASPLLVYLFRDVPFSRVLVTPAFYSTDLLNLVIPTPVSLLGPQLSHISSSFTGNVSEQGAYLGIPFLALVLAAAWATWKNPWIRTATWTMAVVLVASLGPILHVAGHTLGPLVHIGQHTFGVMPGALLTRLPLLGHALPSRFMLYVVLLAVIVASSYLRTVNWRLALSVALLSVAVVLPNLGAGEGLWWSRLSVPRFIASGQFHGVIPAGTTVLAFPAGNTGNWMFDQAWAGFPFRLEESYPYEPLAWARLPIAAQLFSGRIAVGPVAVSEFQGMLAFGRVRAVVSLDPVPAALGRLVREAGLLPLGTHGGVTEWQVPSAISP